MGSLNCSLFPSILLKMANNIHTIFEDKFKVISANTNGLTTKVMAIIDDIKFYDVALLQEVNIITPDTQKIIRNYYNGELYYNKPEIGTRATAIFVSKNVLQNSQSITHTIIKSGQAHKIDIHFTDSSITFLNIYGSPDHYSSPLLFNDIRFNMNIDPTKLVILGGDLNTIIDPILDQENYSRKGLEKVIKGKDELHQITNDLDVIDIFRERNPHTRAYTFIKPKQGGLVAKSRIDRLYVSKHLTDKVIECDFKALSHSDHVATTLSFYPPEQIHHRVSHWKLNVSLLDDEDLKQMIISTVIEWREIKRHFVNSAIWFESLKWKIAAMCKNYGKLKKQNNNAEIHELEQALKNKPYNSISNDVEFRSLAEIKLKLRELKDKKNKSFKIRSRVQELEEDEKMSPYFFKKIKSNLSKRTFSGVKDRKGNIVKQSKEMCEVVQSFYEQLYTPETTDDDIQSIILNNDNTQLNDTDRHKCEGLLTHQECKRAVFGMSKNKTPGSDGLPAEFYQVFWEYIGYDLVEALNDLHLYGELSESQKIALITLLYKKKCRFDLQNWRPISLLNVDLKIISKILSNRLKEVLPNIIINTQTCSVKGRNICENLIGIHHMIEYMHFKQKEGFLVCLDQLKAFDRLDHGWLFKVLLHYKFGPDFIKWIKILYSDIRAKCVVNGVLTGEIKIKRGVRQGCPLSPLLYILAMNPIALDFTKIQSGSGLKLVNDEITLLQYADDTVCFVKDESAITRVFNRFETYRKATGAALNVNKTEVLRLGKSQCPSEVPVHMIKDEVKILGILFDNKGPVVKQWDTIHSKIKSMVYSWSSRNLTTKGKIILANSVALSQLWYAARVLPMPEHYAKAIETTIFHFIWGRKYDPICRTTAKLPLDRGGLGIQDIKSKCDLFLASRMIKLSDPNYTSFWTKYSVYWLKHVLSPHLPHLINDMSAGLCELLQYNSHRLIYTSMSILYGRINKDTKTSWHNESICSLYGKVMDKYSCIPKCQLREPTLNWNRICENMKKDGHDKYTWSIIFNVQHKTLSTGEHLLKRHLSVNENKCYFCGEHETDVHLFTVCPFAKEIISMGNSVLSKELGTIPPENIPYFLCHATYMYDLPEDKRKKLSVIWGTMKYTIWKYRNRIKMKSEIPSKVAIRINFMVEIYLRLGHT